VAIASDVDDAVIDKVMDRIASGFKAGDDSYSVEVMYRPVLEALGGKEVLLAAGKKIREQMKDQNMQIISWKTLKPYQYVSTKERRYAIIPYELIADVGGKRIKQTSYQLGIKTSSGPWQFLNGDKMTPTAYEKLFPDFPKSTKLPPMTRSDQ
jgi:hypothetical protein